MIKVKVIRHIVDGCMNEFIIEGHADFAEKGKDIVCAAVTGVTFGTVNAIDKLLDIQLIIKLEEKGGFLHCIVPNHLDRTMHEKVQLLLEAMLVSLESIASEYGKYITITDHQKRR